MLFGLGFGVKLSVVTTVVSNLFLGMGNMDVLSNISLGCYCLITQFLMEFFKEDK